jgi:carbohydrate diacid regulator
MCRSNSNQAPDPGDAFCRLRHLKVKLYMVLSTRIAHRIVEYIGEQLDIALWVADESGSVLAISQSAAYHLSTAGVTPAPANSDNSHSDSLRNDGSYRGEPYLSLPLLYAQRQVGTLCIVNHAQQVEGLSNMVKTLAEMVIAQMVAVDQLGDQQWMVDRLVYDLIHLQTNHYLEETVLEEAAFLSIDLSVPRVAVVIDVGPLLAPPASSTGVMEQLLSPPEGSSADLHHKQMHKHLLRQAAHAFSTNLSSTNLGNLYSLTTRSQLTALLMIDPQPSHAWRQRVEQNVQSFMNELIGGTSVQLCAGIGEYYPRWQYLDRSYDNACVALDAGRALHNKRTIYGLNDIGLAAYVCTHHPMTRANLTEHLLAPLLHHKELYDTLLIFLQANLSPSAAAKQLHIHRHTLTYRLDKIEELTGQDPRNFQAAALFFAACLWFSCQLQ